MDTFNTIFDSIFSFGANVFTTFFIYGFVGSMIAMFVSIYTVRRMSRAGAFDRPLAIWSMLVSINKVYLPFIAMILVGTLSGIYGVNSSINEVVDQKVHHTLNQFSFEEIDIERLTVHMQGQRTMEELLDSELRRNGHQDAHTNRIITKTFLSELGYPEGADELVVQLRNADWSQLNKGVSFGVSYIATDYIDGIFWNIYRIVFVFIMLSCLKLPILELVIFSLYKKMFKNDSSRESSNYNTVTA